MDFGETMRWLGTPQMLAGGLAVAASGFAWAMRGRARSAAMDSAWQRQLRDEVEAYSTMELSLSPLRSSDDDLHGDEAAGMRLLAGRVVRAISDKSVFRRVMLLMRDAEGGLPCVASIGVDDLTVASLERWGEKVVAEERRPQPGFGETNAMPRDAALLGNGGTQPFQIQLGQWSEFDKEVATWKMSGRTERRQWRRAMVLPIRRRAVSEARAGWLAGAIVVCSDGMRLPPAARNRRVQIDQSVKPLETLARRMASLAETQILQDRVRRAERMAMLGQMSVEVADALSDPLTAVLGYAELIAETSNEARVQQDARTIVQQGLRMRSALQRLEDLQQIPDQPAATNSETGETESAETKQPMGVEAPK